MSEIRKVETPKRKYENPIFKNLKQGFRTFITTCTGQEPLIDLYCRAVVIIAMASYDESKSAEFKKQAEALLLAVDGGGFVTDGINTWKERGFDPYKPFQKAELRQKIDRLHLAIKEFGIGR